MKKWLQARCFHLTTVLCGAFLIICLATNLFFWFAVERKTHEIIAEQARNDLFTTTAEVSENLENLFQEYYDSLNLLASDNRIGLYLKYYDKRLQSTRITIEAMISSYVEVATAINRNILDVLIVNDSCLLNKRKREDIAPEFDHTQTVWYQSMAQTGQFGVWSQKLWFYRNSPLVNVNALVLGVPVYSYEGLQVGAVFFFLDEEAIQQVPLSSKPSENDEVYYIVTDDHEVVTTFLGDPDNTGLPEEFQPEQCYTLQELKNISSEDLRIQNDLWLRNDIINSSLTVIGHASLSGIHQTFEKLRQCNAVLIISVAIYGSIGFILLFLILNHYLQSYLNGLFEMEVINQQPKPTIFREANDLAQHYHQIAVKLQEETEKNYAYALEHSRIRLETLLSQLNPHFLFNALQFLQSEIKYGDRDRANYAVLSLSRLFRFTLNTNHYLSTVEEEVEFTKTYLSLYQQCYEQELNVTFDIDEGINQLVVPKFLLQPIAENAIKHGFSGVPYQGTITVLGKRLGNHVRFIIEDNGHGVSSAELQMLQRSLNTFTAEQPQHKIGLVNIYQRLKLLYGHDFTMEIASAECRFFRITICIPTKINELQKKSYELGEERIK